MHKDNHRMTTIDFLRKPRPLLRLYYVYMASPWNAMD